MVVKSRLDEAIKGRKRRVQERAENSQHALENRKKEESGDRGSADQIREWGRTPERKEKNVVHEGSRFILDQDSCKGN